MGSFAYVSIGALLCYIILFGIFIAARKNNVIVAFLYLIGSFIMWSGGSFFMRIMQWPSIGLWYNISLLGIWLVPFSILNFMYRYTGAKWKTLDKVFAVLVLVQAIINCFTGFFLAAPEAVMQPDGSTAFVYHASKGTYAMYALVVVVGLDVIINAIKCICSKNNKAAEFIPILIGCLFILISNILIIFPTFSGIPLDIMSCVFFAFCIFFMLYRRRMFTMTLILSRGSSWVITSAILLFVFIYLYMPMEELISTVPGIGAYSILIIAVIFLMTAMLVYSGINKLMSSIFMNMDKNRNQLLKEYSHGVSNTLQVNEICDSLINVLESAVPAYYARVCVCSESSGDYSIIRSSNQLENGTVIFRNGHPIVEWLLLHQTPLVTHEFHRSPEYRSMWESEKMQFDTMKTDYIIPLLTDGQLVGLIMLAQRDRAKNKKLSADDFSYLSSVSAVTSIALKNSRLYEKAYLDARTDDLTGTLNRKYFHETLQTEFEKNSGGLLSMMIVNIDDFKLYNQLYGNREGDVALKRVATIIRNTVGTSGYVARYGGKEFAVLLPQFDVVSAKKCADNIREQIYDLNRKTGQGELKSITVSIGICSIPFGASTTKQLINNVDMAVYQVKRNGKNAVMVYTAGVHGDSKPLGEAAVDHSSIYSGYASTIYALTAAIDTKDHYTFTHSNNVAYYATELAFAYGLSADSVEIVREAALLHDIGKIGIPEAILNKPDKLTDEEYDIVKQHVESSIGIIRHLPSLDYVIPAVIGHHERYDGKGYPRRIAGEDIPLYARILCVADCFDAMTSRRCYKEPISLEKTITLMEEGSGTQFDPKLVALFIEKLRDGTIVLQ